MKEKWRARQGMILRPLAPEAEGVRQFTVSFFGWQLSLALSPDREYRRLERRLRATPPTPFTVAIMVLALWLAALGAVGWMSAPEMPRVEAAGLSSLV